MALPSNPQTRQEVYLSNIAGQGTTLPTEPHTREEEYLDYIARNGGGGGGGEGDMTKAVYDDDLAVASAGGIKAYVSGAIADKVDKVNGKGLSTNDYDDSAKAIVDGVTTALGNKADASTVNAILDGSTIDSFGDVETALASKSDLTNLAPAFSTSKSYAIGDYVTYQGKFYRFHTSHSAGAWNALQAGEITVGLDFKHKENPIDFTTSNDFVVSTTSHTESDPYYYYESTDVALNKDTTPTNNSAKAITSGGVYTALADKVDKVSGKGLSTNDYTNADKAIVGGVNDKFAGAVTLLDDTVGWVSKNDLQYPYFDRGNKTSNNINFIDNGNGEITVKAGTATGGNAQYYIVGDGINTYGNVSKLVGRTVVGNPTVYNVSNVDLRIWFYDTNKTYISVYHVTNSGAEISIPTGAVYYVMVIRIDQNATVANDVLISPMICDPSVYALTPTYELYHESVATAIPRYLETSSKSASSGTDTFTLTDSSITSSTKVLSITCDKPMVNYTSITVASGQITITYNTSDSVGTVGFLLK